MMKLVWELNRATGLTNGRLSQTGTALTSVVHLESTLQQLQQRGAPSQ